MAEGRGTRSISFIAYVAQPSDLVPRENMNSKTSFYNDCSVDSTNT